MARTLQLSFYPEQKNLTDSGYNLIGETGAQVSVIGQKRGNIPADWSLAMGNI